MTNKSLSRGMATVSFWADDALAARDWYTVLFGLEAYFQMPNAEHPVYIEFRIGDDEDEFGIIDRRYAPAIAKPGPSGTILLWHVDNVEATLERLKTMGATEYEPLTKRGDGFVTASVLDPFGNILGIMYNPHYLERHGFKSEH